MTSAPPAECPHGFPTDRITAQGLPLCPHCRRSELRRRRYPRHPAYDPAAAAANDRDLLGDDDDAA